MGSKNLRIDMNQYTLSSCFFLKTSFDLKFNAVDQRDIKTIDDVDEIVLTHKCTKSNETTQKKDLKKEVTSRHQ